MKKLLIILVLLLAGCTNDRNKPKVQSIPYGDSDIEYRIVIIDSCEYIYGWRGSGYGGPMFTHKGNCKNPIHSKNIEKITVRDTIRYKLVRE